MIIVSGQVTIAAGEFEKAKPALMDMITETRKEPGCLDYVLVQDPVDANVIRIFERWENELALQAHFGSPHMSAFNAALGAVKLQGADVWAYEAEPTRKVM